MNNPHFIAAAFALAFVTGANAQSEASALSAASALPLASVALASTAAAASVAIPVELSAMGAVYVIKAVEASARGTVYLLERTSDGVRVSVEVTARGAKTASLVAGTLVTATVIGTGVVLSAAGEAVAFVPNALGRALLHNERLTN